jgi:hypothetical protein
VSPRKWGEIPWVMGLSASAIAHGGRDYPRDPSDLVRCAKYCESRDLSTESLRLRMASRSVEWKRLTDHWDDLVALLKHEVETRTDGMAPRTYAEMKRVLADGVTCAACDGTGRGEECPKCKGTGRRCGGRCRADRCYRGADYCTPCRGHGFTTAATMVSAS